MTTTWGYDIDNLMDISWHTEKRKISELIPAPYNPRQANIVCRNCSKVFQDYPYHYRIFCCKQCYTIWQENHPEYTRNKGIIKLKCTFCEKEFIINKSIYDSRCQSSPKKQKKLNFCSCNCQRNYFSKNIYNWRNNSQGKNNPNWKGGISKEKSRLTATKKYKEFVKGILTRDNNCCKICQSKISPEIHHIIPFYKNKTLFFEVNNVITLCYRHHQQTKQKEELYITIFNNILKSDVYDRYEKFTNKKAEKLNGQA